MASEISLALIITLCLGIGIGILGYLISRLITPRKDYPFKFRRFETGNPPTGKARGLFVMQYFAYLIIFLTVEPIIIYLFVIMLNLASSFFSTLIIFLVLILALIPPLIFGLDEARKVRLWILEKEEYT